MRIAIDARLNAYRQGGIPQYTRQLLTALAEVAPEDDFVSLQHRDQLRPLVIAPNVARRTALTPETCRKFIAAGAQVRAERGLGRRA